MLAFGEHVVAIRGYKSDYAFRKLIANRVIWVCEADRTTQKLAGREQTVITSLVIATREPNQAGYEF